VGAESSTGRLRTLFLLAMSVLSGLCGRCLFVMLLFTGFVRGFLATGAVVLPS